MSRVRCRHGVTGDSPEVVRHVRLRSLPEDDVAAERGPGESGRRGAANARFGAAGCPDPKAGAKSVPGEDRFRSLLVRSHADGPDRVCPALRGII